MAILGTFWEQSHGGGQRGQGERLGGKNGDPGRDRREGGADHAGGVLPGDEQGAQDGDGQHAEVEALRDDLGAVHLSEARCQKGVVGHGA